jgi:hypothetical protein
MISIWINKVGSRKKKGGKKVESDDEIERLQPREKKWKRLEKREAIFPT